MSDRGWPGDFVGFCVRHFAFLVAEHGFVEPVHGGVGREMHVSFVHSACTVEVWAEAGDLVPVVELRFVIDGNRAMRYLSELEPAVAKEWVEEELAEYERLTADFMREWLAEERDAKEAYAPVAEWYDRIGHRVLDENIRAAAAALERVLERRDLETLRDELAATRYQRRGR